MVKSGKNKKQNRPQSASENSEKVPVYSEQPNEDPEPTLEDVNDENDYPQDVTDLSQLDPETLEKARLLIRQQSKGEKKARKAFEGLGLVFVPGITRVVFRRPRNELIVIAKPEVFKSPDSDLYVIYGEPTMANGNLPAHAMAAEQMARQQYASIMNKKGSEKTATPTIEPEEELEMDLPPGIEEKDVELVMNQADLNRAQAIKAIIKNNGDVVNAIMDVTSS